jgi:predicted AlkP superfamily phosphohydrolase/phosphomutase
VRVEERAARGAAALLLALGAALAAACRSTEGPATARPVVVVGIDGAEWSVIRELWAEGKLPALRAMADAGIAATLRTDYAISPVIWTTIATGQPPRVHGITDFVVPTPQGDVPVASTLRRVPALWNMASTAGRRVAVVSWWASWPAEAVRGVVVSDRALLPVRDGVFPASFAPRLAALEAAARSRPNRFGGNPATARRDLVTAEAGVALASEGYDLTLVYFRGVDVASHLYWRHFRPRGFAAGDSAEVAAHRDEVPRVYEATDAAIGRLRAAVPSANFFVVSDHGFRRMPREEVHVDLPLDRVLERLGWLAHRGGGIDWPRTRAYVWASPSTGRWQKVRFALAGRDSGGTVLPAQRPALRADLERDLARVTWEDGRPVFRLRDPRPREARDGADLVVVVLHAGAGLRLRLDGEPWDGVVEEVSRLSGTHGTDTDGIFLAAGPDVDPAASGRGIHIHDLAPTVLYALGLPVADDFVGRARTELFRQAFRDRQPLRRVATWGKPRQGRATASEADAELVRELKALGYLR